VDIERQLRTLVDETLNLEGRSAAFVADTPLLGAVPELDSMGVVSLITAFEDRLGFAVDDDEIDGSVFQTWGSLLAFVRGKLGA
jgi:acyl carrier protein